MWLIGASAFVSLALWAWVFWLSAQGFDFTDEGFYLASMADPGGTLPLVPASLFGFVLKPFYLIVDGDVAALRRANVLAMLLLTFLLSRAILARSAEKTNVKSVALNLNAIAMTAPALLFTSQWLLTPNYRSLAIQGMMIALLGFLRLERHTEAKVDWAGAGALALGGWLTFLAKPTSAALLALAIGLFALAFLRGQWRSLVAAGGLATLLLGLAAVYVSGSLTGFARLMMDSASALQMLGSGQTADQIFRIDEPGMPLWQIFGIGAVTIALLIAGNGLGVAKRVVSVLCIMLLSAIGLMSLNGRFAAGFNNFTLFAISAWAVAFLIIVRWRSIDLRSLPLALLFLACPHFFAFGTNNNYWVQGSAAGIFWVLAPVFLLGITRDEGKVAHPLIPITLVFTLITANSVNTSLAMPYRQAKPLHIDRVAVSAGPSGKLWVSLEQAAYVAQARQAAQLAGMRAGDPALDLTGRSPGLLWLLRARPTGLPWQVGGYPGSNKLAAKALTSVDCTVLARSYLLIEPDGPRRLDPTFILSSFGALGSSDYRNVGEFRLPSDGEISAPYHRQVLLKPVRPFETAKQLCIKAKSAKGENNVIVRGAAQ